MTVQAHDLPEAQTGACHLPDTIKASGVSDTTSVLLELSGVAEEGRNRSEGDRGTSRPTGGQGGPPREGLVTPSCKREVGTERAPGKVSGGWDSTLAPL